MPRRALLSLVFALAYPLQAQPTWHAIGLVGDALAISPPGCAATWYDPEVFLYPDGTRGFLAQGGHANDCITNHAPLDSLYSAKINGYPPKWTLPAANSCPTLAGRYADTSCPGQEFFAPYQPLASPAIAKVGSRYYMAFSGGNADLRKGHIFWAYSDDAVHWTTFKWNPKPAGYNWLPLIYSKFGDFCKTFGVSQLTLSYDAGTDFGPQGAFYIHFNYYHQTGELDTYTFRFPYSNGNGFGIGGPMQVCLNQGVRGSQCTWVSHSGAMVFDYDGQPTAPGDPIITRYGGNVGNFDFGSGSMTWDPSHNNWLRVFTTIDWKLHWQTTTSLASGVWSAPQLIDMTQFHSAVRSLHPTYVQSDLLYYGGLFWGRNGSRTGMWLFQPADYLGCASPPCASSPTAPGCTGLFTGLGIFQVGLDFF